MASVEVIQSGVVIFNIIGDIVILGGFIPDSFSIIGILLILTGWFYIVYLIKKVQNYEVIDPCKHLALFIRTVK